MITTIVFISCIAGAGLTTMFYAATWYKEYRTRRRYSIINRHYQKLTVLAVAVLVTGLVTAQETAYLVTLTQNHPLKTTADTLYSRAAADSLILSKLFSEIPEPGTVKVARWEPFVHIRSLSWEMYIEEKRVFARRNGKRILKKR